MIVSIWKANLIDVHKFINKYNLDDRLVQFVEDHSTSLRGYWIVLKLSEWDVGQLIKKEGHPRLTVMM